MHLWRIVYPDDHPSPRDERGNTDCCAQPHWVQLQDQSGLDPNAGPLRSHHQRQGPGECVLLLPQRPPDRELVERFGASGWREPDASLVQPRKPRVRRVRQNPLLRRLLRLGRSTATQASYLKTFTNPSPTCTPMQFSIADSPDILQFCLSVSGTSQTVAPQQIPTFDLPNQGNNSEPYLGNNGFYQGIQGYPAISSRNPPNLGNFAGCNGANGCLTTLNFTNIQVTAATGAPATNWTLVTGDAESTDTNEFNLYTDTSVNWNILPNTTSSFYGDSCYDTADPNNNGLLKYTGPTPTSPNQYVESPSNPPTSYDTPITINATAPYSQYPTNASSVGCEADVQLQNRLIDVGSARATQLLCRTERDDHHAERRLPGSVPWGAPVRPGTEFLRHKAEQIRRRSGDHESGENSERGDTLLEVLLALAVILIAASLS